MFSVNFYFLLGMCNIPVFQVLDFNVEKLLRKLRIFLVKRKFFLFCCPMPSKL
jgi:hypothetical protein